jgi:26S proteasome regulatory subunit N8
MSNAMIDKVEAAYTETSVVHPTVLLSIVDHYNRNAQGTQKRVVGCLLGEYSDNNTCQITNSYAVPFEEEKNEPEVWFFDHIYLENMFEMQNRINSREKIVGWYSSGPKIRQNDI